ncbi:MAG: site-2 protease family protein [Candidatus Zipacnadales bacterium]
MSPLWRLIQNPTGPELADFLSFVVAITIAITVHEFAHAKSAQLAGDPTPGQHGRVTLNPLAHFDPIGTLALLLAGFGWGRPVPVNPFLMKRPRIDNVLCSLWGPLSNFIVATLFAVPLRLGIAGAYTSLLEYIVIMNLVLGLFNLIPIHPLDGSHILSGLLPIEQARRLNIFYHRYGMMLLLILIVTHVTRYVVFIPASVIFMLLTGAGF